MSPSYWLVLYVSIYMTLILFIIYSLNISSCADLLTLPHFILSWGICYAIRWTACKWKVTTRKSQLWNGSGRRTRLQWGAQLHTQPRILRYKRIQRKPDWRHSRTQILCPIHPEGWIIGEPPSLHRAWINLTKAVKELGNPETQWCESQFFAFLSSFQINRAQAQRRASSGLLCAGSGPGPGELWVQCNRWDPWTGSF